MFRVVHKKTGEIRTVYGIAGLLFLFWNQETSEWESDEISDYRPLEA